MVNLVIAVALASVAVLVAVVLQRRRPAAPTQDPSWTIPSQLDRNDFDRPDAPWLVASFTSATCASCAAVWRRAAVLASDEVAVQNVEAKADVELHRRYRIDAVPLVVVADRDGLVRRYFLGPLQATDLWGTLAELRSPGSVPPGCIAHD